MKFWQIVQGVSKSDLSALSALIMRQSPCRRTHRQVKCQNAHCWWIQVDKVQCFASILLITPLPYIHSPESGSLWTSEPDTWRKTAGKREKVYVTCHSSSQPAGRFLLIHRSTFWNEAMDKAEGQTNSSLSAILLSLLIMWDNCSHISHSTPSPSPFSLQHLPPSLVPTSPPPLPAHTSSGLN